METLIAQPSDATFEALLTTLNQPLPRYKRTYETLGRRLGQVKVITPVPISFGRVRARLGTGTPMTGDQGFKQEIKVYYIHATDCVVEGEMRRLLKPTSSSLVVPALYREPALVARYVGQHYLMPSRRTSEAYLYFSKATGCLTDIRLFKN